MATQEQITTFVNKAFADFPRRSNIAYPTRVPRWENAHFAWQSIGAVRPTRDDIVRDRLSNVEFKALQLGTWLNTPDGDLIAQAVEAASPPFYREDVELIVDSLKYAAALQRAGQVRAAKRTLGLTGLGIGLLAFTLWLRRSGSPS